MESSMKPVWKCCLNCHFLTATAKGYKYSWISKVVLKAKLLTIM